MTQLEISLDQNYWEGQGIEEIQCRYWYGEEEKWTYCVDPQSVGSLVKIFWDNGSQALYRVTAVHDLWIAEVEEVR